MSERVIGQITVQGETITLIETTYADGHRAVVARDADGLPYGTLSVNLPESDLAPDEIAIKTWSENGPLAQAAADSGYFEITGRTITINERSFGSAPVWRIR